MYFGRQQTIDWCNRVSNIATDHPAFQSGLVQLFILPSVAYIDLVGPRLRKIGIKIGAQNLFQEDAGAYTGEISGSQIHELGCDFVEIGHAERRRLFGETDQVVAEKTAAAVRNNLTPVLCVGETEQGTIKEAVDACVEQIEQAGSLLQNNVELLVAYEPVWAIGANQPASREHIASVSQQITRFLDSNPKFNGSRVIYGGSAGPGLITELDTQVAGMFLGRFVHDPENLVAILDEVLAMHNRIAESA